MLHVSADWCSLVEHITIKCLCPWPTKFLKADFFNIMFLCKLASWSMTSQQKIECLGKLIPKTTTSTCNGKHQLLIHMLQVTRVLGGLMLIPIFATHFIQARFNQARLPCGLNSCIILYFILLSMTQAYATYGRNWGSMVWKVWVGSFQTFCMSPTHACYQVGKGH